MKCGTILLDKNFQFSDGPDQGQKLAVVLCEFGTNHLIVKTTTSQAYEVKKRVPGCQINDNPPNYFLPKGSCWFDVDTWIELDEVFEYVSYVQKEKEKSGTVIVHGKSTTIPLDLMKKIIDCALLSDRIDQFYLDHLRMMRARM